MIEGTETWRPQFVCWNFIV